MPEYVELLSSYLVVKHWLEDMQKLSGKNPIWRTLHVDMTIPEDDRKFAVPDVHAKDSFQIPLEVPAALTLKVEPSFKLCRGKTNNQTLIYPPVPTLRESQPRLLDVQFHPRKMILRFMIELPSPQEFWMRRPLRWGKLHGRSARKGSKERFYESYEPGQQVRDHDTELVPSTTITRRAHNTT
ncbi:hypothetical protein CCMSSC00406_0009338 [Pleurotus cornucopiae]|uniref:Uncharacterized protein n=1 Tax=Pleurotus cornucopiae TaxID=5321 RepID=A0ACB7IU71_PLECO|nr:hypothetical protein CCMSSC00406_0009338 [Pleurotus cornucopiae]